MRCVRFGCLVYPVTAAETSQEGGGRGVQVSPEFLAKLVQLAGVDIADRPEAEPGLGPVTDVKSTPCFADNVPLFGTQAAGAEWVDHVLRRRGILDRVVDRFVTLRLFLAVGLRDRHQGERNRGGGRHRGDAALNLRLVHLHSDCSWRGAASLSRHVDVVQLPTTRPIVLAIYSEGSEIFSTADNSVRNRG